MKKTFLALALAGAFSSPVWAQSSVTIYGIADAGIQHLDVGAASTPWKVSSGQINGSRLGFRGVEDLGDGLKANFVLEAGLNLDDGTSGQGRTFGRRSTVGLSSATFGTVDIGRDKTNLNKFIDSFDPYASGYINNGNGLGGGNGSTTSSSVFYTGGTNDVANLPAGTTPANSTGRTGNTIFYSAPSINGFSGGAQYSVGEAVGDNKAGSAVGLHLRYTANGLDVGYVYFRDNKQTAPTATTLLVTAKSAHLIAASYTIDDFKPVLIAQQVKDKTTPIELKQNIVTAGVTYKISSVSNFIATYSINDDKTEISTTNKAAIGKAKQLGLGYNYDLSKRTRLYVGVAKTSQDKTSKKFGAVVAGANVKELTFGVRHNF